MNENLNIQKLLFQNIKTRLPAHASLVDQIADVLEISPDSSYRRIRCEKQLSIIEAYKLASHFNLSIDNLFGVSSNSVTFNSTYISEKSLDFHTYLESLLDNMNKVSRIPDVEIIFQLNELNLYHVIQFPELLAFKIYFWSKSSLEFDSFKEKKFSLSGIDENILNISAEISEKYITLNTTELLTQEFLISLLKQIEFYYDSGFFENKDDVEVLCDRALELTDHLRKQAEVGYKFRYGINPPGFGGKFNLYSNDLTLVDNVIMVWAGDQGTTYLTNGAINLLQTNDQDFYRKNLEMAQNIMKRSTLISGTAERERNQFFNNIGKAVNIVRQRIMEK